jgi:hypothetical protein
MPTPIQNIDITLGGTAQELVPARIGRSALIIMPQDEGCWVNCGGTAVADSGGSEWIAAGQSAAYTGVHFPTIGGAWSVLSATTGADIVVRET